MKIIVGRNSGFCFGVKRAIDGVSKEAKNYGRIKCLGNIVHNEVVVEKLKRDGVIFVNSLAEVEKGDILAIRAHGVDEATYKMAAEKNINILDYTCPKVVRIHKKIKEADMQGYQVIIVGKKAHPEVLGSKGYSSNAIVIESVEEVNDLQHFSKVFCIVQTTFSNYKYKKIERALKAKYENIICDNTICQSTEDRQNECMQMAKNVEFMIIIGGKESFNTHKLYEVAKEKNANCILVQDENDKKIEESSKYDIIGIMSGASTPNITVDKVIEKLKSF